MKALLLFHIRVGVRIAVRSFAPLFAAIVLGIMLDPSPAAATTALALQAFSPHPSPAGIVPVAILAFGLPLWATPKISSGLTGWIRHLSFSSSANKHSLTAAIAFLQAPLWASLLVLGIVAHLHGCPVWKAVPRLSLLMAAGTYSALPVNRRAATISFSIAAAACALSPHWAAVSAGILLLILADLSSGTIREAPQRKPWRPAASFFDFKIAWRALGPSLALSYILSLLLVAATSLFAANSGLDGVLLRGAGSFGGCMAAAFFLSSVSARLAERRPPWPWARSFPTSSHRRVANDAVFLILHSFPVIFAVATINGSAMWALFFTLPFLTLRAVQRMRVYRERRTCGSDYVLQGAGAFLESFATAALLALIPWTVVLWIAAALPAYVWARKADLSQKVSRWLELHYIAAGDPVNWSNR